MQSPRPQVMTGGGGPGLVVVTRSTLGQPESKYVVPVVLPQPGNLDARVHLWADVCFWTRQMAEHALFLKMMTVPELYPAERNQAAEFHRRLTVANQRFCSSPVPTHDRAHLFLRQVQSEVQPLINFKKRLYGRQLGGEFKSFAFPTFIEHVTSEAERFLARIERVVNTGDPVPDRREVRAFWGRVSEEHSLLIAHLLDPREFQLVNAAFENSRKWREALAGYPGRPPAAAAMRELDADLALAQETLNFDTAGEVGIEAAKVRSIIHPVLADHVRREALKCVQELMLASGGGRR